MSLDINQCLKLREIANETETPLSVIKIDNKVFKGYFTYSFFIEKVYTKEPERSISGVIGNLNTYTTFLVPKVKIHFNALSIDLYRDFMKLILSKNEFLVECYNIIEDKTDTYKMYFYPQDYPELFTYDLKVLGVLNYSVELIGTNNEIATSAIVYHSNPPSGSGTDTTFSTSDLPRGTDVIIGSGCTFKTTPPTGYKFKSWNTKQDGTGFSYMDSNAYTLNEYILVLYAQWVNSDYYTMSYNYGNGEEYVDSSGNHVTQKTIKLGDAIGELPSTTAKTVTYRGVTYTPYEFDGWYTTPTKGTNQTALTANSLYNVSGNSTIYQLFTTNNSTITFNANFGTIGGADTYTLTQPYGTAFTNPTAVRTGYTFLGWFYPGEGQEVFGDEFTDTTMPPTNIVVKAKWSQNNA